MPSPFDRTDYDYFDLPEEFFQRQGAAEFPQVELAFWNSRAATELNLPDENSVSAFLLRGLQDPVVEPFAGAALAYAGHQFGHFTILGDGRALLVGQHLDAQGRLIDLQLKGSGPTPFSRRGDGKGTLSSMLRELTASEALAGLGVPTTRTVAVLKTGERIVRNGLEPGGILLRAAASHWRVGSLEWAYHRGDDRLLRAVFESMVRRHDPDSISDPRPVTSWLKRWIVRQTDLMIDWQRIGFIHGVMNTDNTSLSGETIDFGPCAFLGTYRPDRVFSSIDVNGRYAFARQPAVLHWNMRVLLEALSPLWEEEAEDPGELERSMCRFLAERFDEGYLRTMANKLGLERAPSELIERFWNGMAEFRCDFTQSFLALESRLRALDWSVECPFLETDEGQKWLADWTNARTGQRESPLRLMQAANPTWVPTGYATEVALENAVWEDGSLLRSLLDRLQTPYVRRAPLAWTEPPSTDWETAYRTYCGT